jgi:bifunctional N-acetylglucosamine-1-phosphate-uridyltransferase/glucosamine-1-phosphate-acetyltransferase GlmU-like protein
MDKSVVAVIMAGGLGKRIGYDVPKVLLEVGGIPMIIRLLKTLKYLSYTINLEKIIIVVGKYAEQIKNVVNIEVDLPKIVYINQKEALGTGHAIMCCESELSKHTESDVLILSGDVPMLSVDTMKNLIQINSSVKLITTNLNEPTGYGRIKFNGNNFEKIIEHKDCNEEELKINQINCGIYCIKSNLLCNNLKHLTNKNSQSEYYLTDIIEIIKREECVSVGFLNITSEKIVEIIGVNTIQQLRELEELIENKIEIEN